jgi:hypothetical protein
MTPTGHLTSIIKPQDTYTTPEDSKASTCFETGQAITRIKLSHFCDERLVLALLKQREDFVEKYPTISDQALVKKFFGCYKVC